MSNSIIEYMLGRSNRTIVLICADYNERKRIRDMIWNTSKECHPSLVKVWLPTAYTLRCITESEIILATVDTAKVALRGRSIDVLLFTNTIGKEVRGDWGKTIWYLSQQLKPNSVQGTFYEIPEEI